MNVNTDYSQALELAKQAAEAARTKVKTAQVNLETEKAQEADANNAVDQANSLVSSQENIYALANEKVVNKQAELNNAQTRLSALSGSEDEDAISQAQAEVDRIKAELEKVKEEALAEHEELLKLQQDAQVAIKRAEIEKADVEKSLEELGVAEEELAEAELALEEAEAAAKAAELELEKEVTQLTEEEAIEQGYTVIKTAEDLEAVRNNLGGKYILLADIDLSGIEWEPIGQVDPTADDPWGTAFSGIFSGNGFAIKNLTVKAKDDENPVGIGLFGATNNAEIYDVKLANINVSASEEYNDIAVGGLIGISRNTEVDNVTVTGNITGHQAVGGLIGMLADTQGFGKTDISNCKTNVDVKAAFYAGGLIGKVGNTAQNSLMINNCHTMGNVVVSDSAGGGLIGEAGKTVITVNNCSSSVDVTRESDLPSELSWLLDTSRIGGIIGNCNGTYITICNSEYTGILTSDDEFKGENYGWYMNDAQVSIYELPGGLPVDDILNIEGVSALEPIVDPNTGLVRYEVQVSTLAGMNRIVDMIQNNPKLAEIITYRVNFDFETMDEEYENSNYSQYGVVQHIYEDSEGNVVNDVYIDNEIDLETTFNAGVGAGLGISDCENDSEFEIIQTPEPTMVSGLYKDADGKYYILTYGSTRGNYEHFTEVSLEFFFANQKTIVASRLQKDEVKLRENIVSKTKEQQDEIQKMLAQRYGIEEDEISFYVIQEPEYKALKKKEATGAELTNAEKFKIELFELNYTIANIVGDATKNKGCGMGGDASFLEETTGIPLEDEWGRVRYMTLKGEELRQKVDENGELVVDDNGNPVYETVDGEEFIGNPDDVFAVRGFPITNEEGGFLFSDSEGNTVIRTENEDGTYTYTYEDGTPYEGDPEELTQQLEERTPVDIYDEVAGSMEDLYALYESGGKVDPRAENYGIPQTDTEEEIVETELEVTETEGVVDAEDLLVTTNENEIVEETVEQTEDELRNKKDEQEE